VKKRLDLLGLHVAMEATGGNLDSALGVVCLGNTLEVEEVSTTSEHVDQPGELHLGDVVGELTDEHADHRSLGHAGLCDLKCRVGVEAEFHAASEHCVQRSHGRIRDISQGFNVGAIVVVMMVVRSRGARVVHGIILVVGVVLLRAVELIVGVRSVQLSGVHLGARSSHHRHLLLLGLLVVVVYAVNTVSELLKFVVVAVLLGAKGSGIVVRTGFGGDNHGVHLLLLLLLSGVGGLMLVVCGVVLLLLLRLRLSRVVILVSSSGSGAIVIVVVVLEHTDRLDLLVVHTLVGSVRVVPVGMRHIHLLVHGGSSSGVSWRHGVVVVVLARSHHGA